jgi:hypothetical protein
MEQCAREGLYGDLSLQIGDEEGCNIYDYLEVPKVPGNVHFGPSQALTSANVALPGASNAVALPGGAAQRSSHDMLAYTHEHFNVSHVVNSLSFGPYFPGMHYTLDGVRRTLEQGSGMHQYFIKLVPTLYQHFYNTGEGNTGTVDGYHVSVTEHLKVLHKEQAEMEAA